MRKITILISSLVLIPIALFALTEDVLAGCSLNYAYSTPGCVTGDEMSMPCSVAPTHDGNETWICPGGIGGPIEIYRCTCTY